MSDRNESDDLSLTDDREMPLAAEVARLRALLARAREALRQLADSFATFDASDETNDKDRELLAAIEAELSGAGGMNSGDRSEQGTAPRTQPPAPHPGHAEPVTDEGLRPSGKFCTPQTVTERAREEYERFWG